MSNEGRSTNDQIVPASSQALPSSLGLGNSFVIGISSVVGRRPNSQTPNPKRQRNPKHQVPNHAPEAPGWRLRFGAYLGFGFWDLEFSFVSQRLPTFDVRRWMFDVRFIHNAAPPSDRLWPPGAPAASKRTVRR